MSKYLHEIDKEFKSVRFLGFLERIDFPWGVDGDDLEFLFNDPSEDSISLRRQHTNFQFDSILFDDFNPDIPDVEASLAHIRIRTTVTKFLRMASPDKLQEGEWYVLDLVSTKGGPRSWIAQSNTSVVTTGPHNGSNWILKAVEPLGRISEDTFESEAKIRTVSPEMNEIVRKKYFLTAEAPTQNKIKLPSNASRAEEVWAVDVGHGSCVAIKSEGLVKTYFDVGFPLTANIKSRPDFVRALIPATDCFVILSHWDYDHYALALLEPHLRDMPWYTPGNVHLGPRATLLSQQLLRRHSFERGTSFAHETIATTWGTGRSANDSGIICLVAQKNRRILLPSDAMYKHIHPDFLSDLAGLTVPHHGAGSRHPQLVPRPVGTGHAVICAGIPNTYKHPNQEVIKQHRRQGWRLSSTGAVLDLPHRGNVLI